VLLVFFGLHPPLSRLVRYPMTGRIAFEARRSIWTALVRRKAERSFLYARPRRLLNVDNRARNAGLA
jgi:hypothetical protein